MHWLICVAIALLNWYDQCPRSVAAGEDLNRLYIEFLLKAPLTHISLIIV